MTKILMIEDDEELADILGEFLQKNGISVKNYTNPLDGIRALENGDFDIVLLDLTLPNMDGLEVCKQISAEKNIPIIISSARSDTQDKIMALEFGADDYLPKPYDPKELLARINSVLRRYSIIPTQSDYKKSVFLVDKDGMNVYFKEQKLELTRAEFEILTLLLSKPNVIFSRETIADSCKSIKKSDDSKSIDVIIGRLRNKICENSKQPKYIISARGKGYKVNL